jgi:signal recognition particle subunit SRP54
MDQFEVFETNRFVGRLLGKGDVSGLMDKIQDVIPEAKQPELLDTISKGNISMRVLRDIFESFLQMGPISQVGALGLGLRGGWLETVCEL